MDQITQQQNEIKTLKLYGSNLKDFIRYLKICSNYIVDITLNINSNSINTTFMDPASISLISFSFDSSRFIEYDYKNDIKITFNLKDFLKPIKLKKDSAMVIEIKNDRVYYTIDNLKFNLCLIDPENEKDQKIPELNFKAIIKDINNDLIKDLKNFVKSSNETITFKILNNEFILDSKNETNTISLKVLDLNNEYNLKSKFSQHYLKALFKHLNKNDDLKVYFDNDYPLKIDLNNNFKFILAPRVETN